MDDDVNRHDVDARLREILRPPGTVVDRGGAQVVAGNPLQLRVLLGPLRNGVYTVTWRTVVLPEPRAA